MFKDFQNKFNQTMAGYHPQSNTYDYSGMIDESFQVTEEPEEEKTDSEDRRSESTPQKPKERKRER